MTSALLLFIFLTALILGISTPATATPSNVETKQVVSISYTDLQAFCENSHDDTCPQYSILLTAVARAFGPQGLGFLEVTDIPNEMVELRTQVLELSPQLANLPNHELDEITLPEKFYTIGWSHGKEQFQNGQYDTAKGSFYLDPFRPERNVFPKSLIVDLQDPLMIMTHFMAQVGLWVAQLIDAYLVEEEGKSSNNHNHNHNNHLVHQSLSNGINSKARLLYYFPPTEQKEKEDSSSSVDDWCGWHKDHGSLTALLPGLLFGEHVDPKAGLYIQTKTTTTRSSSAGSDNDKEEEQEVLNHQVQLPSTSLGFQLGETVEILSGGKLLATRHAVTAGKSADNNGGGRASLALFLQPEADQRLPKCSLSADESLQSRWRPTFGQFQQATAQAFN